MKSQNQIILDHLERYGSITNMDAVHLYGICRLSGRIHELRKKGYKIETVEKEGTTQVTGRPNTYGVYTLCR